LEEIYGVGVNGNFLDNSIPSSEYSPATGPGTYHTVAGSNDLSSLFVSGAIPSTLVPEPTSLGLITLGALAMMRRRRAYPGSRSILFAPPPKTLAPGGLRLCAPRMSSV
jgi:hypothetical protein